MRVCSHDPYLEDGTACDSPDNHRDGFHGKTLDAELVYCCKSVNSPASGDATLIKYIESEGGS